MPALPVMQRKSLEAPDEIHRYGRITKENVSLDGVEVHRVTFHRGARWSVDLKPEAGTEFCPTFPTSLSGRLAVVMDDGAAEEFGPGDVMMLPPGHDAWTVGDDPCVFVEFSACTGYYAAE